MKSSHALTKMIVVILTIQVAVLPVSFALQIQIKSDIKLREYADKSMERIGMLKAGTVIEIPDDYTVSVAGKPNLELTLNNWLRTGGRHQTADGAGRYTFDGEKADFFFPIRVIAPATGSTIRKDRQDVQKFIALKYLARNKNAFIVTDDAPITTDLAPAVAARPEAPVKPVTITSAVAPATDTNEAGSEMEAQSPCSQGLCSRPSDTSLPVRNLINAVSPGLVAAAKQTPTLFKHDANDLRGIYSNFKKSCGFELEQFIPVVKSQAAQAGVPANLLLAMLTQESAGRCYTLNSETDRTQSLGLFQINSVHNMYPRCTNDQIKTLKSLGSVTRLATGPRCLENPIINLSESIRILKSVRETITGRGGFDKSNLSSNDLWRLTLSAYNGGPKWVLQAKQTLEQFNIKNGTSLDAHNWEDLRIFYMREWLDRPLKMQAFGNDYTGRARNFSVINLAYAENIIGRDATSSSRPPLTVAWLKTVKDQTVTSQ